MRREGYRTSRPDDGSKMISSRKLEYGRVYEDQYEEEYEINRYGSCNTAGVSHRCNELFRRDAERAFPTIPTRMATRTSQKKRKNPMQGIRVAEEAKDVSRDLWHRYTSGKSRIRCRNLEFRIRIF